MVILTIEKFTELYGISRMSQSKALKKKKITLKKEMVDDRWRLVYSTEKEMKAVFDFMGLSLMQLDGREFLVKVVREIKKPAG